MLLDNYRPLEKDPTSDCEFTSLPTELAQEKNYGRWDNELKDHLYREEKLTVWKNELLEQVSRVDEAEVDFRSRLADLVHDKLDQMLESEKKRFERRIERAEEAVHKAEQDAQEQKSQFWVRFGEMLLVILDVALGIFGKGRRSRRQPTTAVRRTMRERGQQSRAEERLEEKRSHLEALQDELSEKLDQIERDFDPVNLKLERLEITPRKSDIDVGEVQLVWLPWCVNAAGDAHPAW